MILVLIPEDDWVVLKTNKIDSTFTNFIRYSIKPVGYRRYDRRRRVWLIHWTRLPLIASMARRYCHHVDWSRLPDKWQMFMVGGQVVEDPCQETNPHELLYVLDDAPFEVIKAAYRALAQLHHPDKGGDQASFRAIKAAFEEIQRRRDSSSETAA